MIIDHLKRLTFGQCQPQSMFIAIGISDFHITVFYNIVRLYYWQLCCLTAGVFIATSIFIFYLFYFFFFLVFLFDAVSLKWFHTKIFCHFYEKWIKRKNNCSLPCRLLINKQWRHVTILVNSHEFIYSHREVSNHNSLPWLPATDP